MEWVEEMIMLKTPNSIHEHNIKGVRLDQPLVQIIGCELP
jgi:hypothetical protein